MPWDSGPGKLWSDISAPLKEWLGGGLWFILHFVIPAVLAVGVVIMVVSLIGGNKVGASRGRSILIGVPVALFLAFVASKAADAVIGAFA